MNIQELKNRIYQLSEENAEFYNNINSQVFAHPELGNQEFWSSNFIVEQMKTRGFRVEYPYCNIPTAFRCEVGEGHPKVAFLAEYDALPGYGPNKNENAHACGHHFIAASCCAAADVLAKLQAECGFKGTIAVIGAPAEESTGGKIDVVNAGGYDDIDAAFQVHLSTGTSYINSTTLAMHSIQFDFEGLSSHAAGAPWKGINALDASYLTFTGINALRQHIKPDARIHGIISDGGLAPNVVPAHAQAKFYVRAKEKEYADELRDKVINCAKGAELMTGAKMTWQYFENSYDACKNNQDMVEALARNLDAIGFTDYDKNLKEPSGCSDLGNVANVTAMCYMSMAVGNTDGASCHEEQYLQYLDCPMTYDKIQKACKAMAGTALDVLLDEELQNKIGIKNN